MAEDEGMRRRAVDQSEGHTRVRRVQERTWPSTQSSSRRGRRPRPPAARRHRP
jgi:hypothetical protein